MEEKPFEEMTPVEHLEKAKELLVTIKDAAKDLQKMMEEFKMI